MVVILATMIKDLIEKDFIFILLSVVSEIGKKVHNIVYVYPYKNPFIDSD